MGNRFPVFPDGRAFLACGGVGVCRVVLTLLLVLGGVLERALAASPALVGWGHNYYGQATAPTEATNLVAAGAGSQYALALRADGTLVRWGDTNFGLAQIPPNATNIVAVAAGFHHSLTLGADGTVLAWGDNSGGQLNVPANATNVVALTGGLQHSVALRADGTVVAWGDNTLSQLNVPAAATNVVAIAAGWDYTLALKADGSLTGWGCLVSGDIEIPDDATNVTAIAAGGLDCLVLRGDGSLVAWGRNFFGENDIPTNAFNVTLVAAGQLFSLATLQDGTVLGWGDNFYKQSTPPAAATNPLAIYAGDDFGLAWLRDPASGSAPRFWLQPTDRSVGGGNTLFLNPGVNGTLPLRFQWYFNNTPMPGQTNRWLALPNANPAQSGGYQVVAANDFGATTSAVANITVPAIVFLSQPTNITAMMNTNVSLTATVSGTGPLHFQWQKNGQDLTDTNRVSGSGTPALAIANLVPSDTASYRLVVTNAYAAVTSEVAVLSVQFPAPLLNVDFGSSAQSSKTGLAALGQSDADFWNGYGGGAPGVTNLLLADGSPTQVGIVVSNAPYAYPNTWTDPMLHEFICPPWPAGPFSVKLYALPAGTYDFYVYTGGAAYWPWLGADYELMVGAVSQGHRVIYGFGADAPPWQEGLHFVTYHNIQISTPGQSIELIARGNNGEDPNLAGLQIGQFLTAATPPVFWCQPAGRYVAVGSNFVLNATSSGYPAPAQQWFHDGIPLTNDARIAGANGMALAVAGAQFADTGDYWAVITSTAGSVTSAVAHVVIGVPPALTLQLANQTWIAGSSYSLAAQVTGTDPLAYQWYFGGAPLTNSARWSGTTSNILSVSNVVTSDAGAYTLVVTNLFGSLTCTAAVAVVVPPSFSSQPAGYSVPAGLPVTLNATVSGTSPFSYQWRRNGVDLPGATSNVLSYAALDPSNYGDYQLEASNFGGAVTSAVAQLTIGPVAVWGTGNPRSSGLPPWPGPGLSNVVTLAAGGSFNLALRADGTVYAWGSGSGANVPAGLGGIVGIGAGANHALAIRSDGTVVAWGSNTYGQTNVPAGLSNVVAVAGGDLHSVALRCDGTAVAWGSNASGQTNVPAGLTGVVTIDANGNQTLALRQDGAVAGWGGGTVATPVPPYLHGVTGIAAGPYSRAGAYNLALLSNGTVAAWSTWGLTNAPAWVTNIIAVKVSSGRGLDQMPFGVGLGLRADGLVTGWSSSATPLTNVPPALSNAVALAGASSCALALVNGGAPLIVRPPVGGTFFGGSELALAAGVVGSSPLSCQWFKDGSPVPGGTNQTLVIPAVQPADGGNYQLIVSNSFGMAQSLAVPVTILDGAPVFMAQPANGFAYYGSPFSIGASVVGSGPMQLTWLRNGLEVGSGTNQLAFSRAMPEHGGAYQLIASNAFGSATSAVARITFSRVASWGINQTSLTNAPCDLGNVLGGALGYNHALAIRGDRTVAAWGGANGATNVPADLSNVVAVAGGANFSLALRSDGTVTNWGPGLPLQTNVLAGLTNVVAIAAGQNHALALRADGTVTAWGANGSGQTNVPTGLSHVVAIAAGSVHSLALREDGTIVGWGYYGMVPSYTNAVAIAAGYGQSMLLQADGTVVAWGAKGAITLAAGLSNVVAISSGGGYLSYVAHNVALRADGTLVAWGDNSFGQLMVPGELLSATTISAGGGSTLALLNDRFPAFTLQPWSRSVVAGTSASLHAFAVGQAPLRYQWYWNRQVLAGATNASLAFSNTAPSLDGAYELVAMNDYGAVTSAVATLAVALPPVRLTAVGADGGGFRFSFNSLAGVLYIVEFENDLAAGAWAELERRFGSGGLEIVTDASAVGASRYYRVRALYAP